jgi:thiol-disulfide isomerase/thioredoxin
MKAAKRAILALGVWLALGAGAEAAEFRAFSAEALAAAQAQSRPIIVAAHANWCPTCRAQAPLLRQLASDPRYENLLVLTLNFDRQAQERRALGIRQQSTLIAFHGARERMRSVGDTDPQSIGALFQSALR